MADTRKTRLYTHEMGGAIDFTPNTLGNLIALLKQCLMDGFNTVAPSGATYDSGADEVLLTFGAASGFITGQVINVSGANETDYNGDFRVIRINNDATEVWYKPDVAPPATATGVLSTYTPPIGGWTIPHEDLATNRIIFKSGDADSTEFGLFIDNNASQAGYTNYDMTAAQIYNITDIDTYDTNYASVWPGSTWYKSDGQWWVIGDSKGFYFFARFSNGTYAYSVFWFGDFVPFMPGDDGHNIFYGKQTGTSADWNSTSEYCCQNFANFTDNSYRVMGKKYDGSYYSQPRLIGRYTYSGSVLQEYPSKPTAGAYVLPEPILVDENYATAYYGIRGIMPGVIQPLDTDGWWHKKCLFDIPQLEGVPVWFSYSQYDRRGNYAPMLCAWRMDDWR